MEDFDINRPDYLILATNLNSSAKDDAFVKV